MGESFADFFDPTFVPVFGTFFSDPVLQAQAEALCGDDTECLFDVATTERLDIGRITLASSQTVEDIITLASTSEHGRGAYHVTTNYGAIKEGGISSQYDKISIQCCGDINACA